MATCPCRVRKADIRRCRSSGVDTSLHRRLGGEADAVWRDRSCNFDRYLHHRQRLVINCNGDKTKTRLTNCANETPSSQTQAYNDIHPVSIHPYIQFAEAGSLRHEDCMVRTRLEKYGRDGALVSVRSVPTLRWEMERMPDAYRSCSNGAESTSAVMVESPTAYERAGTARTRSMYIYIIVIRSVTAQ